MIASELFYLFIMKYTFKSWIFALFINSEKIDVLSTCQLQIPFNKLYEIQLQFINFKSIIISYGCFFKAIKKKSSTQLFYARNSVQPYCNESSKLIFWFIKLQGLSYPVYCICVRNYQEQIIINHCILIPLKSTKAVDYIFYL